MSQTLLLNKKFLIYLNQKKILAVLRQQGYNSAHDFMQGIIKLLNDEFSFLEISNYREATKDEAKYLSQYSAIVAGEIDPFKEIVIWFTSVEGKQGNVIIEQGIMPTVCAQMQKHRDFLLNDQYKKIVVMTSIINSENKIKKLNSSLQLQVSSLNSLNFDVIQFFPIRDLAVDSKFNSLQEYLEMSYAIQMSGRANSQKQYLTLEGDTVNGTCTKKQWRGEFIKSFCFKFLTSILIGGTNYHYNIDHILNFFSDKLDNQLKNLCDFINDIEKGRYYYQPVATIEDSDIVEFDDHIQDIYDIYRKPEKAIDNNGQKRYKTQKKIKDFVLKRAEYLCDCHNLKHFYFESVEKHNYVEAHHIIPMNRQAEYYLEHGINLDIIDNVIPLCPNCHKKIHLGSRNARLNILSEIFIKHNLTLKKINENLTFQMLASYYNIGINDDDVAQYIENMEG